MICFSDYDFVVCTEVDGTIFSNTQAIKEMLVDYDESFNVRTRIMVKGNFILVFQ